MDTYKFPVPEDGHCLDGHENLFIVDVGGLTSVDTSAQQRRAFVDLGAAVQFIGGRAAPLFAYLAPPQRRAGSAVYGVVEEVFKSTYSDTYLVRFSGAPWGVVKLNPSTNKGPNEGFERIYPARELDA